MTSRYLSGNFAPIKHTRPLTSCPHTGNIPMELTGGQYVQNGGNPFNNQDFARDAHWFDGDGMLSGVLFQRVGKNGNEVKLYFVNQYLLTDVFLNAKDNRNLRRPLLPSISTLICGSLLAIISAVIRSILLVILSRFPGSRRAVKRISVANTAVVYHDGRALATCESGPPMRVQLPGLETVGWYNGRKAENESSGDERAGFGGKGLISVMKEWTTGHPRVDPVTGEFISIHSILIKPYVFYSIVPPESRVGLKSNPSRPRFDVPIPGIRSPKLMHDFGVAGRHTIILDLPLSMNPMRCAIGKPVISFDLAKRSRFGVFPRYEPHKIQWFETSPCIIFHTANCWETISAGPIPETRVHLVACRMTSASLLYNAGALLPPVPKAVAPDYTAEEQGRLYYYSFPLVADCSCERPTIRNQWALSAIPFEFPTLSPQHAMSAARFVYGCITNPWINHSTEPRKAAKMGYVAKIDVETLIAYGTAKPPPQITGCVDERTIEEVMQSTDVNDPIKLFQMPEGWYAQEPRFVARQRGSSEDDGWLLTYVFDESQLDEKGECGEEATSELWVIDAKHMRDVVAKIRLPQRVPYGFHSAWFSEKDIAGQRAIRAVRREVTEEELDNSSPLSRMRDLIERLLG
ncbi:retinal pigment epithelial membrane protein [Xylaria nigripes]|nr:retinal pigment epithelial membrane protein [Xylaria nigripes]